MVLLLLEIFWCSGRNTFDGVSFPINKGVRNFIDIVERNLVEMPINKWEISSDFDRKRDRMYADYEAEEHSRDWNPYHYTKADERAIRSNAVFEKAKMAFASMPVKINLFFIHHDNVDYDPFFQRGKIDTSFIAKQFGPKAAEDVARWMEDDAINVIMTNNRSDQKHISLKSSWMLAHRIAHSVLQGRNPIKSESQYVANDIFYGFLERITSIAYGFRWDYSYFGFDAHVVHEDQREIFGKALAYELGTFRSAREKNLVNLGDWVAETYAQWIITGKITFNPLPKIFDENPLTTDPKRLSTAMKLWGNAPRRFSKIFQTLSERAKGQLWVM